MLQKRATKKPLIAVPGYSHLHRRGAIYYFRISVPSKLRRAIGKTEIVKSLGTSDLREAKRLCALEAANAGALFASKRGKLNRPPATWTSIPSLSEAEIHRLVVEWFIGTERESEERWVTSTKSLEEHELADYLDSLRIEETAYDGGNKGIEAESGEDLLCEFLNERGLDCPSNTPTYKKLCEVFRRGRLESIRREVDRITGKHIQTYDPLLAKVFAHSLPPQPTRKSATLGELLDRYLKFIEENRATTTLITYQAPVRILRDLLGEKTKLREITRESIDGLFESIKLQPKNAKQRYPGLNCAEAIAEAEKRGDPQRLDKKTLANYFRNIHAIFNFAVEEKLLTENPTNFRSLREQFRFEKRSGGHKAQFTKEQLNGIFHAPIFTGCLDDEAGYAQVGKNTPRRGRFWVPLLALFQGLRCNEACQLYAEDVQTKNGIPYLAIRADLDDEKETEKHLKNKASIRNIPIHPMLLRIGFEEFVATRRKDTKSKRLFPELPLGKTGRYSNPFSKWFGRFLAATFETKPKGTFHSFRHHFRDALREQRIGDEHTEALGGWAGAGKQQREYGDGPRLAILLEDLSKVEYPGLDLSHLYRKELKQ